jgi:hypothetical protein
MFRLAKQPSSGQLQSLNHLITYIMVYVHIMGSHIAYKLLKYS